MEIYDYIYIYIFISKYLYLNKYILSKVYYILCNLNKSGYIELKFNGARHMETHPLATSIAFFFFLLVSLNLPQNCFELVIGDKILTIST